MPDALMTEALELPQLIPLHSADGSVSLTVMDIGATWFSCRVALSDGSAREVLLSGPTPEAHLHNTAYLGATVGRYANRIGGAHIRRGEQVWALTPQPGSRHQLHGGPDGFDRRRWAVAERSEHHVVLTLDSPDGDQGFPGRLQVTLTLRLPGQGVIEMHTRVVVDAPCPVGLTNHAYFNLNAGSAAGRGDARTQTLRIAAQQMLPVDAELIPLGHLAPVAGTGFDFRTPRTVQSQWLQDAQQRQSAGYDHAWMLDAACADATLDRPAATLQSDDGRLSMDLATTLPSLQFYAGQGLAAQTGRDGQPMAPCAGLALEPQFLPDSPNHPEWPQPSCWVLPGQVVEHRLRYRFRAL